MNMYNKITVYYIQQIYSTQLKITAAALANEIIIIL